MTHVYHVWIRKLGKRWIFIFHIAFQYFQSMYWQEGTCEKELMITFWRSSMVSSQTLVSSYSMSCSLSSFFAAGFLLKSSTSEAICQRKLDSSSQKLLEPPSPWFSDSSSLSLSCLSMISLELPHHDDDVRLGDVPVISRSLWFAACTSPAPCTCTCTLPDARLLLASQFSRNKLPRHLLASRALPSFPMRCLVSDYSHLRLLPLEKPVPSTRRCHGRLNPESEPKTASCHKVVVSRWAQTFETVTKRSSFIFNISRHVSAQFKTFFMYFGCEKCISDPLKSLSKVTLETLVSKDFSFQTVDFK